MALLYPLLVPAVSIYYSGKLLLGGEDKHDWLTGMKRGKLFEHLGEAGPQLILMIIFITNNGGLAVHPFSVISAVFSAGSLLYGIYSSCKALFEC